MFSILLRKALPFTLTLVAGTALGWMFRPSQPAANVWAWSERTTPFLGEEGPFGEPRRRSHGHCRMRRHYLVAESKPLTILYKPDAMMSAVPNSLRRGTGVRVLAAVTFGSDGKVQGVESANLLSACGKYRGDEASGDILGAVKRAAAQIQFEPETVDGVPVTVTREVEIPVTFN